VDGAIAEAGGARMVAAQRRLWVYGWLLLAGMLGAIATLLVVNAGAATILAALVVPVVYVTYVGREHRHDGVSISTLTLVMLGGSTVGAGLAMLSRLCFGQLQLAQIAAIAQGRMPTSVTLLLGVTVPLLGELLKLVSPLLLRGQSRFCNRVTDGAVLGFASGIGYAAASTLVNYWPIVRDGYAPMDSAGLTDWSATLFGLAILKPLTNGTTCGLLGAGIWAAMSRRGSVTLPISAGLAGSVVYSLADLLLSQHGTLAILTLHGLLLAVLLILLRRTVHA
jgi:RsiW-degrading membrane proteinase PrsW (M82 family)